MLSAIITMLVVAASVGFGVGYVCGRGLRREEAAEAEYERAMREEMRDRGL